MSQHRAYFTPNKVDPEGLQSTSAPDDFVGPQVPPVDKDGPRLGASPEVCECNFVKFEEINDKYIEGGSKKRFDLGFFVNKDDKNEFHPEKCAIVQWLRGSAFESAKLPNSNQYNKVYSPITRYAEKAKTTTRGNWWVDSSTKSPVYGHLNFLDQGVHEDTPGIYMKERLRKNVRYVYKFKTCIYHAKDVPQQVQIVYRANGNVGGVIYTNAIACHDWEATIIFDENGNVRHTR